MRSPLRSEKKPWNFRGKISVRGTVAAGRREPRDCLDVAGATSEHESRIRINDNRY